MGQFVYRPVALEPGRVPTWVRDPAGPDARGVALGGAVKLLQQAAIAFGQIGLANRVKKELGQIEARLAGTLSPQEGVLVRITTQTWSHAGHGMPAPEIFVEAAIASRASHPVLAVQKWRSRPRLLQGAPAGWRFRDRFLWLEQTMKH